MTARLAAADTRIACHAVPKGSLVFAPLWLLHRDPGHWPDPSAFDPDRFLLGPAPDRGCFLPFGTGPHVCIGAQLATAEAVLVLAHVVSRFDVSLSAPHRPPVPVATLSNRPDHAPLFRLEE